MNESASASQLSFWSEPLAEELLRFLTGRLKCREAAADLTHENYLRLHRFCQTGTPDNAKAIAFHIAVNLAIDYQRKAAVRNRFTIDADLNTLHDADMADHTASPERILMSRQRFDTLQAALDELPLNCRTAFYCTASTDLATQKSPND